jgi:hypothetical protein
VGGDVPIDSESLLVTDFVNLKIKQTQSFGGAHRDRMCVHVFIEISTRTCMSICVYTVVLKNPTHLTFYWQTNEFGIVAFLFYNNQKNDGWVQPSLFC